MRELTKKKVLFVHHGTGIGGASICLLNLIKDIEFEVDARILCIQNSSAVKYFRGSGITVDLLDSFFYRKIYTYFLHWEGSTYNGFKLYAFIQATISYLINSSLFAPKILKGYEDFDVVYLNSVFLTDWAIAAKKEGKKVIMHVRCPLANGIFGFRRSLLRKVIKNNVDSIITISRDNGQRVNHLNMTTLIYDPIREIDNISPVKFDLCFKYFLYLGGINRIKGYYVLVQSLKYLNPNIRIIMGGDYNGWRQGKGLVNRLKQLVNHFYIKRLRKSKNVIEIGMIHNVFDYLNISTALLWPSTTPHFSNPIMEAYKIGKPIITSDVEGMFEIVDKKTGVFFCNRNSKELAKAINMFSLISSEEIQNYREECMNKYLSLYNRNAKVIDVIRVI